MLGKHCGTPAAVTGRLFFREKYTSYDGTQNKNEEENQMKERIKKALELAKTVGEQRYSFGVPDEEEYVMTLGVEHVEYRGEKCYEIDVGYDTENHSADHLLRILIGDEFAEYLVDSISEKDLDHALGLMESEFKRGLDQDKALAE